MGEIIKKIWNVLTTVVICIVLVFAFLMAGVKIFGLEVFMVKSGSMEPEIKTGSIIYVNEVDSYEDYKIGDIISYNLDEDVVATHRIMDIVEAENGDGIAFITKGDVNDDNDPTPVAPSSVIGKCVFSIPYLGYIFIFIKSKTGILTVISVLMTFLVITMLLGVLFPDKKETPSEEKSHKKIDDGKPE